MYLVENSMRIERPRVVKPIESKDVEEKPKKVKTTGKSNISRITITYSELIKICASIQLTQLAEYDQV